MFWGRLVGIVDAVASSLRASGEAVQRRHCETFAPAKVEPRSISNAKPSESVIASLAQQGVAINSAQLRRRADAPSAVIASEREARSEPRSINSAQLRRRVEILDGFTKWIATRCCASLAMTKTAAAILLAASTAIAAAAPIAPYLTIQSKHNIISSHIHDDKLYISTDSGKVDIYSLSKPALLRTLTLPNISNFIGEVAAPRIFGTDLLGDNLLVLSEDSEGGRRLAVYDNNTLNLRQTLFALKDGLAIKRALFWDKNTILLGLFSSELILYNFKEKKEIWHIKLSTASLNDIVFSKDKKSFFATGESGYVYTIDTATGATKHIFKDINKDKNFQMVIGESGRRARILTAGQDRKMGVYNIDLSAQSGIDAYFIPAEFLIYSVGISADGSTGAMAYNEAGDLAIYDLASKSRVEILKGNGSIINSIHFLGDKVCATSDDKAIFFWNLGGK